MARLRDANVTMPTELGRAQGLAYSLWLPARPARAGVVILHGAGSCKESHHDFARAVVAGGWGAIAFDQRGHGQSAGPMDGDALRDIAAIGALLRERLGDGNARLALRGSSMGGYFAIVAAEALRACAVVAICPACASGLRRGLARGALGFDADTAALDAFLAEHDEATATRFLQAPLLLLHAEGDEQVPIAHSRELATLMRDPASRLIAVPGGHHRSIQHDGELQAVSLRFLARWLGEERGAARR
jgi:alpha-beta hydrolase superfamily lysophospholipase